MFISLKGLKKHKICLIKQVLLHYFGSTKYQDCYKNLSRNETTISQLLKNGLITKEEYKLQRCRYVA